MSYKLADGSLSTDYKIGDKFKVVDRTGSCSETTAGEAVILVEDDLSSNPYFEAADDSGKRVCHWKGLEKYVEVPTYTKPELSYITELEDRVEYLESLCSDYAAEIERLRGIEIGPQKFKPIADMTIEDWQQALDEGWFFEDNGGDACRVVDVDKEMQYIKFDEYLGKFDIQGDFIGGHPYYITKRIK